MFSEPLISLTGLGKSYQIYDKPRERLLQMLFRGRKKFYRDFMALEDVSLELHRGDCLGVVGRNGAGKSTLLQLICGTLSATSGEIKVRGRIAALLELGAGFNPEFTGRENVFFSAAVLGLSKDEISARYEEIVDFSGVRDFIDQPVKTYSSGMYVRLAFSVATCVDPDILVIDEALSVGDGEFARRSFDRIMELQRHGTTILFCSHSLYQVETLCDQALWLDKGRVKGYGDASSIAAAYQATLDGELDVAQEEPVPQEKRTGGHLKKVVARVGNIVGKEVKAVSQQDTLAVSIDFRIDPGLPLPSVALGISNASGLTVSSVTSVADDFLLEVNARGEGSATVIFPRIALLKGTYYVTAFLACENALHMYDVFERCLTIRVEQTSSLQGVVMLEHEWRAQELL